MSMSGAAVEIDPDNSGNGQVERFPGHCQGHIKTACANGQHSQSSARGRMAVSAKQRFSGFSEAFKMHLVTDPVSRA